MVWRDLKSIKYLNSSLGQYCGQSLTLQQLSYIINWIRARAEERSSQFYTAMIIFRTSTEYYLERQQIRPPHRNLQLH